ncbi:MAG: type II secretion system protein [Acetobacteraceae bacterium]|nr:type II secretion system protein [Acetobacteraceae bacterium]
MPTDAQRDGGFTLLEVLVAFVIATLALTVLVHAGVDGLHGAALGARYQEALARARSHLAAAVAAPQSGDRQGDEGDGFHWHVRVAPVASEAVASQTMPGTGPAAHASLVAVSVAISWGDGPRRSVELDSEQVVTGTVTDMP